MRHNSFKLSLRCLTLGEMSDKIYIPHPLPEYFRKRVERYFSAQNFPLGANYRFSEIKRRKDIVIYLGYTILRLFMLRLPIEWKEFWFANKLKQHYLGLIKTDYAKTPAFIELTNKSDVVYVRHDWETVYATRIYGWGIKMSNIIIKSKQN